MSTQSSELITRDIFIRLADPAHPRRFIINQHRIWNADLFLASQIKQYDTEAKPGERRIVSIATAADYRTFRKGARA